MNDSLQIVIALLLYLLLFGSIGYWRGSLRELIVLIVTLGGYLILRQYEGTVIRLINLFGKFSQFALAGGLGGDNPEAILLLRDAPDIVGEEQTETVVFIIWVIILLLTYWLTSRFVRSPRNRSDAMAFLLGIFNGFFYLSIFLPLLSAILVPSGLVPAEDGAGLVLRSTWRVLGDSFGNFWTSVSGQQSLVVVILLTLVLVGIASTLRAAKPKPKA